MVLESRIARAGRIAAAVLLGPGLAGCGIFPTSGWAPVVAAAPAVPAAPAAAPALAAPVPAPSPPPSCSVTLEGDSILNGMTVSGKRIAEPPAAILKRLRPHYKVIDNSAPGMTAGLRAPGFLTLSRDTRFVVLQYGINDATQRADMWRPLRQMIDQVKAEGRTPIVTGISRQSLQFPRRELYDTINRKVAAETGTLFADWGSVRFDPKDMSDPLHPGPAYAERLMTRLAEVLDRAAPECSGD